MCNTLCCCPCFRDRNGESKGNENMCLNPPQNSKANLCCSYLLILSFLLCSYLSNSYWLLSLIWKISFLWEVRGLALAFFLVFLGGVRVKGFLLYLLLNQLYIWDKSLTSYWAQNNLLQVLFFKNLRNWMTFVLTVLYQCFRKYKSLQFLADNIFSLTNTSYSNFHFIKFT